LQKLKDAIKVATKDCHMCAFLVLIIIGDNP